MPNPKKKFPTRQLGRRLDRQIVHEFETHSDVRGRLVFVMEALMWQWPRMAESERKAMMDGYGAFVAKRLEQYEAAALYAKRAAQQATSGVRGKKPTPSPGKPAKLTG